jgi:nicotinamide riboside kinase
VVVSVGLIVTGKTVLVRRIKAVFVARDRGGNERDKIHGDKEKLTEIP